MRGVLHLRNRGGGQPAYAGADFQIAMCNVVKQPSREQPSLCLQGPDLRARGVMRLSSRAGTALRLQGPDRGT
jgi:hypothetical protein